MKKIVIFAGFFGMLILGTNAMATAPAEYSSTVTTAGQLGTDSTSYPTYTTGTQTIGSNTYTTKDSDIKIATTKYVDTNATTTQTAVSGLTTTATADNTTVTSNGTAITSMISDRQVAVDAVSGTNAPCKSLDTNTYSGCGYMVADGGSNDGLTASQYTWFKIIK